MVNVPVDEESSVAETVLWKLLGAYTLLPFADVPTGTQLANTSEMLTDDQHLAICEAKAWKKFGKSASHIRHTNATATCAGRSIPTFDAAT